jgi:hypothetical protein
MKSKFLFFVLMVFLSSCLLSKKSSLSNTSSDLAVETVKTGDVNKDEPSMEDVEYVEWLFQDTKIDVEFIVLDSLPVDTVPVNRYLVLDLRINMSYEQTLPLGSDFWEYNKKGIVQILDTLEFHY